MEQYLFKLLLILELFFQTSFKYKYNNINLFDHFKFEGIYYKEI